MRDALTLILAGWLVAFAGTTSSTWAAGDPISEKIERERKTLEQLKDKIEEKRKRADEAEKKRESFLQGIQTLDERLMRTRQEHQDISKKLPKKDREIEAVTEQLGVIRTSIQERRDAILARLRVQYMEGRAGYVKALLASDSYGDFQDDEELAQRLGEILPELSPWSKTPAVGSAALRSLCGSTRWSGR